MTAPAVKTLVRWASAPSAKQTARCATCGHLATMHENDHGGCWQALSPTQLCLCRQYVSGGAKK